jgi:hypothetical protein
VIKINLLTKKTIIMNSYNENLQSSVLASLMSLQLAQKSMKSKLDASIFSLYYAEGATINAKEKLGAAVTKYQAQQRIKAHAVTNNNISINLLNSANQQKTYTAKSVANTAVSASNVQIASNAIVRLASDMGSIYSILKAADFDSEIYLQGEGAYNLISETAYDAEKVSQSAMEASTFTAEVSSSTVADEAKSTNSSIANLFDIVSSDFDTISATVAADNAALADASAAEKKAEGILEFINVEYFATKTAYILNNVELNLNLSVPKSKRTEDSYVVAFDYYKSPFTSNELGPHKNSKIKPIPLPPIVPGYPVKNYYIMLVKDSKKLVFTISNAEGLLLNKNQYIEVPAFSSSPASSSPVADNTLQTTAKTAPKKEAKRDTETTIFITDLLDSDGDLMELGQNYVVFVLAVFMQDYKKAINNFDDYLSAPSATFKLTHQLSGPGATDISVTGQKLEFKLASESKYPVEYRCMFLPDNGGLVKGILSENGLRTVEQELEKLETIANKYDPLIAELQSKIDTIQSELEEFTGTGAPDEQAKQASGADNKANKARLMADLKTAIDELKSTKKKQKKEMDSIDPAQDTQPGFFFNLKLAEQVSAANYSIAKRSDKKEEGNTTGQSGSVTINESTTDNFGDMLIEGKSYIPVVLTASTASEEDLNQFTNYLSPYDTTKPFIYESKH